MIKSVEDFDKIVGSMGGGDDKPITNQQRKDYNDYVKYLQKRGIAGSDKLDKNNLGKNLFAQYVKDHPKTSLTPDLIVPLQHDLANVRKWSIENNGVPQTKLTDKQLEEFANFSGADGAVAQVKDLNKKLDEYGLKGAGNLYDPIKDDLSQASNVTNVHQDWISTTAAKAIAKAKALGIPATPEAFEENKKVIFGDDKYGDTVLNNKDFQRMYPNYVSVVAHIYKDRSSDYDKMHADSHMADHKVIDGEAGSRMTSLTFPDDYMKAQEKPESETDKDALAAADNVKNQQQ